ncbi:hypothetical protein V6Z12_D05G322700 [Gossypium hirsutum]
MTYQGVLSPPGGVSQRTTHREGKSCERCGDTKEVIQVRLLYLHRWY